MRILAFVLLVSLPLLGIGAFGMDCVAQGLMRLGFNAEAAIVARDPIVAGQAYYAAHRWADAAAAFRKAGPSQLYNLGNALSRGGRLKEAVEAYDRALEQTPDDEDAAFNRALIADLLKAREQTGPLAATEGGANSVAKSKRKDQATDDDTGGGDLTGAGEGHASGQEVESKKGTPGGSQVAKSGTSGKATEESGEGQARGSAGDAEGTGRRGGALAAATEQWRARERRTSGKSWEGQSVLPTRQWLEAVPDDPGKFLKLRLAAERAHRLEDASLVGRTR